MLQEAFASFSNSFSSAPFAFTSYVPTFPHLNVSFVTQEPVGIGIELGLGFLAADLTEPSKNPPY